MSNTPQINSTSIVITDNTYEAYIELDRVHSDIRSTIGRDIIYEPLFYLLVIARVMMIIIYVFIIIFNIIYLILSYNNVIKESTRFNDYYILVYIPLIGICICSMIESRRE
jgi:hypothetical protein